MNLLNIIARPRVKGFGDSGDRASDKNAMWSPLMSKFILHIFRGFSGLSIFTTLFLLISESGHSSTKESIPDPPNLFQFKSIPLKTVALPPSQAMPNCDEDYRLILESGTQSIWKECSNIGKSEPSDCQRSLFQICTDAATKLRNLQIPTCKEMVAAQGNVREKIETFTDQQTSQADNQSLNAKAALAQKRIAARIESDAKTVSRFRKETEATLNGSLCAASTSLENYLGVEKKVVSTLKNTEARLEILAAAKLKNSEGYKNVSDKSATNQTAMKSATSQPNFSTAANPNLGAYEGSSSGTSKDSILKAAAVGVPAAALLGIAMTNGAFRSPMVGAVDNTAQGGDSRPPSSPSGFEKHDMVYIDRAFTDRENAIIKAAYARIPKCHLPKLKNISILNRRLPKSGSSCVAGLWSFLGGRETISLTPFCSNGVTMNTTVHEFLHAIGFENGRRMYSLFAQEVIPKFPGCAVTDYAKTDRFEDFSESGRLALVPEQIEGRRTDACVNRKVAATLELIRACK